MITCTSTHCERRQECCSPSDCTGSAKYEQRCDHCDGYGFVWNNADPTSGQFHICEVCGVSA